MVVVILREAKIFDLLIQKEITRMPTIPTANYDDNPEMIEISSSEDEEGEAEVEIQKMTLRRLRRVVLGWSKLQAKLAPGMMKLKWMMM